MVRIKHRYLLINILYPEQKYSNTQQVKAKDDVPYGVQFRQPSADAFDGKLLMRIIRDGVAELFGDYGSGKVSGSLQVKYLSPATSTAIVRVSREHYRLIWAALTFTTRLPRPIEQPCVIQVVRVSGTIRKAEEEAIRRARISIRRAQRAAKGNATANLLPDEDDDADFNMLAGIEDKDEPGDVDEESDEAG